MDKFFDKFPTVYYDGVMCKDITRRISINNGEDIQGNLDLYYPHTLKQHLRPDQVAGFYYEDPEKDWMVFLANDVIDPYYGWYLDQRQFGDFIIEKYGSIENAQRQILFWRNNWYNDSHNITPSFYENNLDKEWRKYYEPIWGPGTRIMGYKRRPEDQMMNTNRIVKYEVSDNGFTAGEPVTFHKIVTPDPANDAISGTGQVASKDGTAVVFIQHLQNDFVLTETYGLQIRGTISGHRSTVSTNTTVLENIGLDEQVFWSPVTAWDYEEEINESKKDIYLVAKGADTVISQQITKELKLNTDTLTGMVKE